MRTLLHTAALLCMVSGAAQAQSSANATDTMPAAVVQRFVDGANGRDAVAMGVLLAPDAVFESFPDGRVIVQGRDSIQAYYARLIKSMPSAFYITVQPRIVEGEFVIDQEHFAGEPAGRNRATWMYLVRGGLIQRAWVVNRP